MAHADQLYGWLMAERRGSSIVEFWDPIGNYIVEHVGSQSSHSPAEAAAFAAACCTWTARRYAGMRGAAAGAT